MSALTVTALQGETLDALVWRVLGRGAPVVEAVQAANRHLAALGPHLPQNTPVTIPASATALPVTTETRLWD